MDLKKDINEQPLKWKKVWFTLLFIGLLFSVKIMIHMSYSFPYKSVLQRERTFYILWYAKPIWIATPKDRQRVSKGCEYSNCELLFEREKINISDAVLFHHTDMNITPPKKNKGQLWVFVSLESPVHTSGHFNNPVWFNKFDWTFSYRTDSEVSAPYGKLERISDINAKNYSAIFQNKTKNVAWIVSNCNTHSKRELYVKKLKEFIDVDVYGRCGQRCKSGDCFRQISKEYKFYLSFENSLCSDYVTEKVYRLYSEDYDIVPVVRGAPNIKDILPPDTMISTLDFKTVAELANFLNVTGSNEELYTKYLISKGMYRKRSDFYEIGMCEICKNLNTNVKSRYYSYIGQWLTSKSCLTQTDIL